MVEDDSHDEHADEQVEQNAELDQLQRRLQQQQAEHKNPVFQDDVSQHLHDRLAARGQKQETG